MKPPVSIKDIARPNGLSPLTVLKRLRHAPLPFVTGLAREHGDIVPLDLGLQKLYLVTRPDFIESILQTNHGAYRKSRFYQRLKPLFGDGMIVAEGDEWRRQRKAAQPSFGGAELRRFADYTREATQTLIGRWRDAAQDGAPVDVVSEMMRVALDVILRTLLGTRVTRAQSEELHDAITTIMRGAEKRVWAATRLCDLPVFAEARRFRAALATLDDFVYGLIDDRVAGRSSGDDFLSAIVASELAHAEIAECRRRLRDQIVSMIVAGHETTASALAWTWIALAERPDVVRALRDEHGAVLGGGAPGFETLSSLKYTQAVFEEILRLHPPVWTISREAAVTTELGGIEIPAGTSLMLCPYVLHRDPRYWPDPERFDPARFVADGGKPNARYAYFPFGGGPRACIGARLAITEAKVIVPMILAAFDLELAPDQEIRAEPMISLRPAGAVWMRPRPRNERRIAAAA